MIAPPEQRSVKLMEGESMPGTSPVHPGIAIADLGFAVALIVDPGKNALGILQIK